MTEVSPEQKLVLHVGCGPAHSGNLFETFQDKQQWREIRQDINPEVAPDIVCSMTDMRGIIDSDSMDAVWSSHNLEHLYAHEVVMALNEFHRVLKPNGVLVMTLPDLESIAEKIIEGKLEEPLYQSPSGPISPIDILYGHRQFIANGNHFMAHKTGFTAASLSQKLSEAGFKRIDIQRDTYDLWAFGFKGILATPIEQLAPLEPALSEG